MKPERSQRIEQIFHEALEIPAGRRGDFVAQACADDDALRLEVESLLAERRQSGEFLSTAALDSEASGIAKERPLLTTALQAGYEFSHYKVDGHYPEAR